MKTFRIISVLLLSALIPACSDRSDSQMTTVPESQGSIKVPAQLLNVHHDGHLYVVALFEVGGAILHSPACPREIQK